MFASVFEEELTITFGPDFNPHFFDRSSLEYVIDHVFFPVDRRTFDDFDPRNAHKLARAVHAASRAYNEHINHTQQPHWYHVTKMLENLQVIAEHTPPLDENASGWELQRLQKFRESYRDHTILQLDGMKVGDILVFPEPHCRAVAVFRKHGLRTLYESFRISGSYSTGNQVVGPEHAIEIPNQVFDEANFRFELARSLSDGTSPVDMLRGVGRSVEPKRVTKYVYPSIAQHPGSQCQWSRSALWFFIRVTIQSSLDRSPLGHATYKTFMLFFMCNLANYAGTSGVTCVLLHSMSTKILRRFRKLEPTSPQWLRNNVSQTCTSLSWALDQTQRNVQVAQHSPPPWDFSQLDLTKDIQHSLPHIHDYISSTSPSHSGHRETDGDFLPFRDHFSYRSDVHVHHDVKQDLGKDIDDWVSLVTNIDEACELLEHLVHRYQSSHQGVYGREKETRDPDHFSVSFLTIVELWVALDKLVVKQIPILADYSPEIPLDLLSKSLLRDAMTIHRVSRVHQYLFARYIRAHPGQSVLSNEFTDDSFACRYYDRSSDLQLFKARIQDVLPLDPSHAKVVVFELRCPVSFSTWRSVTCLLCGAKMTDCKQHGEDLRVRDIPALQPHIRRHWDALSLYSSPHAPRSQGRLYYVYERSSDSSSGHLGPTHIRLPGGPYADSQLEWYLQQTEHTSNEVLAAQASCNPDLSLQEFVSFAHLRSGGSLQWFNILRELRSRTLDFRHQEVYLLLAQASTQVGPLDDAGELIWHQETQDPSFCHALLNELQNLFADLGAGSLDGPAMAVISLLAGLLVSRSVRHVSERAIRLLRTVRAKTFDGVYDLLYNVRKSPENEGEEGLQLLRDMAAVCRSTFDVGSEMCRKLLHSPQDIEVALSCSMIIYTSSRALSSSSGVSVTYDIAFDNNAQIELSVISTYSQALLNRDHSLSFVLEQSLKDAIQADIADLGIDRAVQMVWPGHHPNPLHRWEHQQPPKSQWLICETVDRHSQTVHVNLHDGSLLLDDKPIVGGLPDYVTSNFMYRELFGNRVLTVVASELPGMDFVTIFPIHNYNVHFGVRRDDERWGEVVIRAECNDTGDIFERVPSEELKKDLPKLLIWGHVHWLNLSTYIIEIRPIKDPWKQSSDSWKVHLQSGQSRVIKEGEFLVDRASPTWKMVANRFTCLDDPNNLIVSVTSLTSLRLSVTLPRYGLSFFTNENGHLESLEFKDMIYDEDQCIGTLLGLVNRLVLRPKARIKVDLVPRCILIPCCGSCHQRGHNVYLDLSSSDRVNYYTYHVDRELGCLKGTAGLASRLYLANLHALTGRGCRPDPLTGRTGLEEAISITWLAGNRQQSSSYFSQSWSSQLRFASETLVAFTKRRDYVRTRHKPPSDEDVLREAYLFPSEASAGLRSASGKWSFLSLDQLLRERPPPNLPERDSLPHYHPAYHGPSQSLTVDSLRPLFSSLQTGESSLPFQSQYISRLHSSAYHFQTMQSIGSTRRINSEKPSTERFRRHYLQCRVNYLEGLVMVKRTLGPKTEFGRLLDQCGQWPRVTPFILFRSLASTSPIELPETWKKCLISLSLLALDVQRARRLLLFSLDNMEEELNKELENEGCDGWDAAQNMDWLLIQLQGNFLIRRVQADIAKEMMHPRSGKNSVMQVNIGEGKTSVIIPICAAALADGNQLVRVIVPKALIPQTLQLLSDRLCGLVNRPIYHLTFSRDDAKVYLNTQPMAEFLMKLVKKCKAEHGVIVMQPEHVLSLKLACVMSLYEDGTRTHSESAPIIRKPSGFRVEHILHVLTGSLLNSLTKDTYISTLIEWIKRWRRKSEGTNKCGTPKQSWAYEYFYPNTLNLLELQRFFETHTRDILDESDDVLRPQFQVIYAIGNERPFEGSPDRWVIIQQVLGLVARHTYLLSTHDSHTIRCDSNSTGSFPHIHLLHPECGERLVSLIVQDVLDGRLPSFRFHPDSGLIGAMRQFMLQKDIHPDTVKQVETYARHTANWGSLLLLRGLLANKILLFALTQRRWRVDYGLDPKEHDIAVTMPLQYHQTRKPRPHSSQFTRSHFDWLLRRSSKWTMLAIPYHAKDMPAETAQFGHPDVTILLTCLSYYYGGLREEQLRTAFEFLLQQDDPAAEYALWLEDCGPATVPDGLQTLSSINIRSFEQWDKHLVPFFTRNKRAIDLYLSKVVFPNHAKDFPRRISTSYWDVAEKKSHLVTGFSGTNDGQYLLPTSIAQDDQDYLQQTETNAKVLACILQPENASYMVTADEKAERWTTLKLIRMIVTQHPQIRVLLDVGAQILDLSNIQVAAAWLGCTPATDTIGAIFFSDDDELMVLARNGTTQPLSSSPLTQQLYKCVAYLDHAHTRGTDIKFPVGFRAAVTLGHRVTKDHLVQGCMRMRKLGHGHSVMFFAPHDVDQRIRSLVSKQSSNIRVTTADILHWAIQETWGDIQKQALYWAQQGMNHQSRYEAWSRFCHDNTTGEELAEAWVQPELKSLADMYMPCQPSCTTSSMILPQPIRERCENMGVLSLRDVRMDEEQEREVSREVEREREVERPPRGVLSAKHFLHPDVVMFVKTGVVPSPSWSNAFRHIFATDVTATSSGWSPYVLATADFCETVEQNESVEGRINDYLRPVQWILSGKMCGKDAIVLVSPFEADQLMPEIRVSKQVHLHLYIPRTTKRMKPADDLMLYTVPPLPSDWTPPWSLIDQLNLFAGQLYLRDYTSYVRLSRFLGVHTADLPHKAATVVTGSWFGNVKPSDEEIKNKFEGTSLPLAMQLIVARRGVGFSGTHMGQILEGLKMTEEDFTSLPEEPSSRSCKCEQLRATSVYSEGSSIDEDDEHF